MDWKIVHFRSDNMAIVCSHLMHLIRLLVFFASYHNFWFFAFHIEGKQNTAADALSRNNLHTFFLQAPLASLTYHLETPSVSDHHHSTWTSISWTKLFFATLWQL